MDKNIDKMLKTLALIGAMGAGLLGGCCSHGHGYRVDDCGPYYDNPGQARPFIQKRKKPKRIYYDDYYCR